MTEIRFGRQSIQYILKERDENNKYIVAGKETKDCYDRNSVLGQKIIILSKKGIKSNFSFKVQSN